MRNSICRLAASSSKFIETLSNIMKKIDDTQSTIVQNMK
jgi:hypothetical protein